MTGRTPQLLDRCQRKSVNRTRPYLLAAPALTLLGGFVLVPLVLAARVSLYEPAAGQGFYAPGTVTVRNYRDLGDAHYLGLAGFTIAFAAAVAAGCLAIGYPLALFIRSLPARRQALAVAVVLLPKVAGTLATLFGLQRMLPRGLGAAIVAEIYLVVPYVVLVLAAQLRTADPTLAMAARGLGAGRWQTFRRVTWPLSLPGVVLAGELGLAWGLGAFAGPLFLGGPTETTLSVDLHRQAFEYGRWPRAAAEAMALLALVLLALAALQLRRPR